MKPPCAAPLPFEREHAIRFSHCDPAGIVFFPQYFVLLNQLAEQWFDEALRLPYAELIGTRRVGLPTVRLECDFTAPSRMGETVSFGLEVERLGERSIALRLQARRADELRLRARQVLAVTSLVTHKSIEMPADMRDAIRRFTGGGAGAAKSE